MADESLRQKLRSSWAACSARERVALTAGAGVLAAMLVVGAVWLPALEALSRIEGRLPGLRAQVEEMRSRKSEVARLKAIARPAPMDAGQLRTAIGESARARGVELGEGAVESLGNGEVRLNLSGVWFDAWVGWLAELQATRRIHVDSCKVEALADPGQVRVEAVLRQPETD
ncbi:MAG: type II secretion system protein M [Betaproteobacteria bacterium]|nr:type II secretion system protein M [Betaproteobacteria bacterium]